MRVCAACGYSAIRSSKRASDPLVLELQAVMDTMWVLGIESRSSGRVVSALTAGASLQSPDSFFKPHVYVGVRHAHDGGCLGKLEASNLLELWL